MAKPLTLRDAQDFAGKYTKGPAGCWIWKGVTTGYGTFRGQAAHRVAWQIEHGLIPDGMMVLHRCDNPPCVNPKHLFLGTARDNAQDARSKGRVAKQEPTDNTRRAFRINAMKLAGMTWAEIARIENVTPDYARALVTKAERAAIDPQASARRRQAIARTP
jgi:hypothetical protein